MDIMVKRMANNKRVCVTTEKELGIVEQDNFVEKSFNGFEYKMIKCKESEKVHEAFVFDSTFDIGIAYDFIDSFKAFVASKAKITSLLDVALELESIVSKVKHQNLKEKLIGDLGELFMILNNENPENLLSKSVSTDRFRYIDIHGDNGLTEIKSTMSSEKIFTLKNNQLSQKIDNFIFVHLVLVDTNEGVDIFDLITRIESKINHINPFLKQLKDFWTLNIKNLTTIKISLEKSSWIEKDAKPYNELYIDKTFVSSAIFKVKVEF